MKIWANYLKPWLGYIWVIAAIFVSIIGLINQGSIAEVFIIQRGYQVTENWRGGKVDSVKVHDGYQTIIHQPVFEGLLTKKSHGFIRIDWTSEQELPAKIVEVVDYNHDGRVDFIIRLNTSNNTVDFHSYHGRNLALMDEKVLVFERSRSLRIKIHRENKMVKN